MSRSGSPGVLLQVVRPVALMLGLPTGMPPVERPQAERLHIIAAEMWKKGVEVSESPTLKSWAVRHPEWTANHVVRSDVEMVDGSIVKVSPDEAHPGKCAAAFMKRILVRAWEDEPARPGWKVGCLLGVVGTDVEVLEAD